MVATDQEKGNTLLFAKCPVFEFLVQNMSEQ